MEDFNSNGIAKRHLKIVIIMGSMSGNRLGDRVYNFIQKHLLKSKHAVYKVDPKDYGMEVFSTIPLHWYGEDVKNAPAWLRDVNEIIKDADSFFIVTPEFNGSVPSPLKTLLDYMSPFSFAGKPAQLATYSMGPTGGMRCHASLMTILSDLNCITVPFPFYIPYAGSALTEAGIPASEQYIKWLEASVAQLVWYAEALRTMREMRGALPWRIPNTGMEYPQPRHNDSQAENEKVKSKTGHLL